jgi:hypothetical protein
MDKPQGSSPFAIPAPRELDLQLSSESVDHYKKSDCRRYLECLDVAAEAGWQQFHCRDCHAYEAIVRTEDDKALLTKLSMFFRGE